MKRSKSKPLRQSYEWKRLKGRQDRNRKIANTKSENAQKRLMKKTLTVQNLLTSQKE